MKSHISMSHSTTGCQYLWKKSWSAVWMLSLSTDAVYYTPEAETCSACFHNLQNYPFTNTFSVRYSTWKAEIEEARDKGTLFLSLKPPQELEGGLFRVGAFLPKLAVSSIQSLYLQSIALMENRRGLKYRSCRNVFVILVCHETCAAPEWY